MKGGISMIRTFRSVICLGWCTFVLIIAIGCVSFETKSDKIQSTNISQQSNETSQSAPEVIVQTNKEKKNSEDLSYGMITSRVQKGVTTQNALIELFGGPNIATTDSDGVETWVYERTSRESEILQERKQDVDSKSQVQRLGLFFGVGTVGTVKNKSDTYSQSSGKTKVTHSIKSLTVIIKFNADKTVRDYSVRSSNF